VAMAMGMAVCVSEGVSVGGMVLGEYFDNVGECRWVRRRVRDTVSCTVKRASYHASLSLAPSRRVLPRPTSAAEPATGTGDTDGGSVSVKTTIRQ
jgi:hypothetical protein